MSAAVRRPIESCRIRGAIVSLFSAPPDRDSSRARRLRRVGVLAREPSPTMGFRSNGTIWLRKERAIAKTNGQRAGTTLDAKTLYEHRFAVEINVDVVCRLDLDPGTSGGRHFGAQGRCAFAHKPGKGVETGRPGEVGQDRQVQEAVVDQRVRAERHAASGLPAIADRERDKRALPGKALGAKDASVRRKLCEARDAGDGLGQPAEAPLELGVCLGGDARAEAARDEIDERPVVDETEIDRARRRARRDP